MDTKPVVSVLMPVFNGEKYLAEAIESILNQTFDDFEFLIINDGSTDGSAAILERYRQRDQRIRVYDQSNQGLVASLNCGLELAQGEYVARMDADDISLPERLAKQVGFMEAHPDAGVCGTWVELIGERTGEVWRYSTDDATIRCRLLFESALAHSTVIMRRELFVKTGLYYDSAYKHAEDYALWVKSAHCAKLANLPEMLLLYRLHPRQIGQGYQVGQLASAGHIRRAQLQRMDLQPTDEEFVLHQSLSMWQFSASRSFIMHTDAWLCKMWVANQSQRLYPEPEFSRVLGERWFAACRAANRLGVWTWKQFRKSPLGRMADLSGWHQLHFGLTCLRHQIGF